ncbi:MAG: hypothetical protein WKG00_35440 [Polyangiaceae bacterium]
MATTIPRIGAAQKAAASTALFRVCSAIFWVRAEATAMGGAGGGGPSLPGVAKIFCSAAARSAGMARVVAMWASACCASGEQAPSAQAMAQADSNVCSRDSSVHSSASCASKSTTSASMVSSVLPCGKGAPSSAPCRARRSPSCSVPSTLATCTSTRSAAIASLPLIDIGRPPSGAGMMSAEGSAVEMMCAGRRPAARGQSWQ